MSHEGFARLEGWPPALAFCFRCAALFEAEHNDAVCPECGYRNDPEIGDQAVRYAYGAGRFGYQYRKAYEKAASDERGITQHYFLPAVGDAVTFTALAVLGGIIGNASWEACKAAVRRIGAQRKGVADEKERDFIAFVGTPAGFEQFVSMMREYRNGLTNVPEEVRNAVLEERMVHEVQDALPSAPSPDADLREVIHEAMKTVLARRVHSPPVVEGMFAEVPKNGDSEEEKE